MGYATAHLGIQPTEFWRLTLVEYHAIFFAKNPQMVARVYKKNFWTEEERATISRMKERYGKRVRSTES